MLPASDLRHGMAIRLEGEPYKVMAADYHGGGGKMGGVTHAKLRNLRTGTTREQRFRGEEPVELLEVERRTMQFLYAEGEAICFMSPETFDQINIEKTLLGHGAAYLSEGMALPVEFLDGQPVGVAFPEYIEVRVDETAPPAHALGDSNVWKEARLENGVTVLVPPFVATGERIRVDVEAGKYVGRAREERERKK